MDYSYAKDRLHKYFSRITYIDDAFDSGLVLEKIVTDVDNDDTIVPADFAVSFDCTVESTSENPLNELINEETWTAEEKGYEKLGELISVLNKDEFQEIDLTPVLYDDELSDDIIISKMERSNLTIIDWDLGQGTGKKALPIIKAMLDSASKLKVVVVYTNGFPEAVKSAREIFNNLIEISGDEKTFCFKCKCNSLVLIVNRQSVNLLQILDLVENTFIEVNGLMSVSMLDLAEKIQERSDEFFGDFATPIDDAYFLQMYYSGVPEDEWSNCISDMIMQKCKNDIKVDEVLIDEMIQMKKDKLILLIEQDEFLNKFNENMNFIKTKIDSKFENLIDVFSECDDFDKKMCKENIVNAKNWSEVIRSFNPFLKKIRERLLRKEIDTFWEVDDTENIEVSDSALQILNQKIKKTIDVNISNMVTEFKQEIFPVIIQMMLVNTSIIDKFADLVHNLKYLDYEEKFENMLGAGKNLERKEKQKFLLDKIHFGDILYKESTKEYLLCVTPPCDVFRPEKVELNYVFITGAEVCREKLQKKLKESMHITTYPYRNNEGVVEIKYVKWKFYDIQKFNLEKKDDYEKMMSYHRDYRLAESYTRQIANKFIAYYSRAGVDEIFFKQTSNLIGIL